MKFPIGFSFVRGWFTYEVIGYNPQTETYQIIFGFSPNDDECDVMEMTEGELQVSSDLGV